jgi:hypothetical protein
MSNEVERIRRLHTAAGPELVLVSQETFRRLPLAVREWYGDRFDGRLPTELAARCLVNDFLYAKYSRGGYRSVDGYKIWHKRAGNAPLLAAGAGRAA